MDIKDFITPNKLVEMVKEVERMDLDSPYCHQFLKEHGDKCNGCESAPGCMKLIKLQKVILSVLRVKSLLGKESKNPNFDLASRIWITSMFKKILNQDSCIQEKGINEDKA